MNKKNLLHIKLMFKMQYIYIYIPSKSVMDGSKKIHELLETIILSIVKKTRKYVINFNIHEQ